MGLSSMFAGRAYGVEPEIEIPKDDVVDKTIKNVKKSSSFNMFEMGFLAEKGQGMKGKIDMSHPDSSFTNKIYGAGFLAGNNRQMPRMGFDNSQDKIRQMVGMSRPAQNTFTNQHINTDFSNKISSMVGMSRPAQNSFSNNRPTEYSNKINSMIGMNRPAQKAFADTRVRSIDVKQIIGMGMNNPERMAFTRVKEQRKIPRQDMWKDYDKDGYPNILDCAPFDKNRHGFLQSAGNFVTGKGWQDNPAPPVETEVSVNPVGMKAFKRGATKYAEEQEGPVSMGGESINPIISSPGVEKYYNDIDNNDAQKQAQYDEMEKQRALGKTSMIKLPGLKQGVTNVITAMSKETGPNEQKLKPSEILSDKSGVINIFNTGAKQSSKSGGWVSGQPGSVSAGVPVFAEVPKPKEPGMDKLRRGLGLTTSTEAKSIQSQKARIRQNVELQMYENKLKQNAGLVRAQNMREGQYLPTAYGRAQRGVGYGLEQAGMGARTVSGAFNLAMPIAQGPRIAGLISQTGFMSQQPTNKARLLMGGTSVSSPMQQIQTAKQMVAINQGQPTETFGMKVARMFGNTEALQRETELAKQIPVQQPVQQIAPPVQQQISMQQPQQQYGPWNPAATDAQTYFQKSVPQGYYRNPATGETMPLPPVEYKKHSRIYMPGGPVDDSGRVFSEYSKRPVTYLRGPYDKFNKQLMYQQQY